MKTIFSLVTLIIWGLIANFISVFVLNLAGLPGTLLAGAPGKRSKRRFIFGSIVSALCQSYAYLAYVAFVVNWTLLAAKREDVVGFLLWPVAFLAIFGPMWSNLMHARIEDQEAKHANPQVEALYITTIVTLVGFFVFIFAPSVMHFAWGWLPYMNKLFE